MASGIEVVEKRQVVFSLVVVVAVAMLLVEIEVQLLLRPHQQQHLLVMANQNRH